MANNLATLSSKLATALGDTDHETWNSTEKDDLVTWAVANLYPRFARPMVAPVYPLTADTENYTAPAGMLEVHRIDVAEVATNLTLRVLDTGTWYTYDDRMTGGLSLFVNARYSNADHYYVVHGVGRYDTSTELIPDDLVPLVTATARSEAYRRILGQRARFLQWQQANHESDVTINELLTMTQEATAEQERLRARLPRTHRRPVPARLGR